MGPKRDLQRLIADLPAVLAGRLPDRGGSILAIKVKMCEVLLARITDAYVIKSQGGTDAMGIKWPQLAWSTLQRRNKGNLGPARAAFNRLNSAQQRLFRKKAYAATRLLFSKDMTAKRKAFYDLEKKRNKMTPQKYQQKKRDLLKGKPPAQFKNQVASGVYALILIEFGKMLAGFTPRGPNNFMKTGPGWIEVGSTDERVKYHDSSLPRQKKADGTDRLPRRQIMPDGKLPYTWSRDLRKVVKDALHTTQFWKAYLGARAR